jgi:hypothetical protein
VRRSGEWKAANWIVYELARVAHDLGAYMMIVALVSKEIPPSRRFRYVETHLRSSRATDFCDVICVTWRGEDDDSLVHIDMQKNRHGASVHVVARATGHKRLTDARVAGSEQAA